MLRSRAFLTLLRQTPLRTPGFPLLPSPATNVIKRPPQSLRNHQLHQRKWITIKASSPTHSAALLRWRPSIVRRTRNVRWNSNQSPPSATQGTGNQTQQSLSQRFKELSRRYGYAAVGVYLGLSVIDFPFCFLAVRLIGPERIGELEHAVVDTFWSLVAILVPSMQPEDRTQTEGRETEAVDTTSHKHNENASIWTQLLLAYGVHKSLIFFRVPLTAAVTPKVVKTLRSWGWNIGRPAKTVKSS